MKTIILTLFLLLTLGRLSYAENEAMTIEKNSDVLQATLTLPQKYQEAIQEHLDSLSTEEEKQKALKVLKDMIYQSAYLQIGTFNSGDDASISAFLNHCNFQILDFDEIKIISPNCLALHETVTSGRGNIDPSGLRLQDNPSSLRYDEASSLRMTTELGLQLGTKRTKDLLLEHAVDVAGLPIYQFSENEMWFSASVLSLMQSMQKILGEEQLQMVLGEDDQNVNSNNECLRAGTILVTIDQWLKDKSEDKIWNDREAIISNFKTLSAIYQDASLLFTDPSLFLSLQSFESQYSAQALKEDFSKKFEETLDAYQDVCIDRVAKFYESSHDEGQLKNWVHINNLLALHKVKNHKMPSLGFLNHIVSDMGQHHRLSGERAYLPTFLELVLKVIPYHAHKNNKELEDFTLKLAHYIESHELSDEETYQEFQKFVVKASLQFTDKTENSLLNILEGFYRRIFSLSLQGASNSDEATTSQSGEIATLPKVARDDGKRVSQILFFLEHQREALIRKFGEDVEKKIAITRFFIHALSRVPHEVVDPANRDLVRVYGNILEDFKRVKFSYQDAFSLSHVMLIIQMINLDSDLLEKYEEFLLSTEALMSILADDAIKGFLKSYFVLAYERWKNTLSGFSFQNKVEKAQIFLKSIGLLEVTESWKPPKEW